MSLALGAWLGAAAVTSLVMGAGAPRIARVQLAPDERVLEALSCEIDGRAGSDLALATAGAGGQRSLALHVRTADGTTFERLAQLAVTPDVVAFAVADVHADPGAEVVLLNARGVYAWRPRADGAAALARLFAADVLWQVPDEDELFAWQPAVHDLDGDGLVDLLVPEPQGYRVAFQARAGDAATFERVQPLELPRTVGEGLLHAGPDADLERDGPRTPRLSLQLSGGGTLAARASGPLVTIRESVPAPALLDFDADGDLDVLAHTARSLLVWLQQPTGSFAAAPTRVLTSPVERDLARVLDVSYSAHAVELDRDGRADCVVFARDTRSDDVRTQGQVFLHGPDEGASAPFGERGVPESLLVLAGFVTTPHFQDLDGDGDLDLYTSVVRPDLIDAVRAATAKRIDVELLAFLNQRGAFARAPSLAATLSLSATSSDQMVRFVGDVTGDGIGDVLVRRDEERLVVLPVRAQRGQLTLGSEPALELALASEAELEIAATGEILVVEPGEVLCIGLR